jgi:hypothetical protein
MSSTQPHHKADRHTTPAMTVRPDPDALAAARTKLDQYGIQMWALITATLAAFGDQPEETIKLLSRSWPQPRPPGRPRKPKEPP